MLKRRYSCFLATLAYEETKANCGFLYGCSIFQFKTKLSHFLCFSVDLHNIEYFLLYDILCFFNYLLISVVIQRFITSEDVCCNRRNVKLKNLFSFQKCIYISLCLSRQFAFCFFLMVMLFIAMMTTIMMRKMTMRINTSLSQATALKPQTAS